MAITPTAISDGDGKVDKELVMFLEPDQFTSDTAHAMPRATLGPSIRAALWTLRVFVLLLSVMVIYAFAAGLK